jgi:hypothetical protein
LNWFTAEFSEDIYCNFVGLKDPVIDGQFCKRNSFPLNFKDKISAYWLI